MVLYIPWQNIQFEKISNNIINAYNIASCDIICLNKTKIT